MRYKIEVNYNIVARSFIIFKYGGMSNFDGICLMIDLIAIYRPQPITGFSGIATGHL